VIRDAPVNTTFEIVTVELNASEKELATAIIEIAMKNYHCNGVEEYSLEQKGINQFLGQRVLVEWEIPAEVYQKIDDVWEENQNKSLKFYFTGDQAHGAARLFNEYIMTHYPGMLIATKQEKELDWNSEWKKDYSPIPISPHFTIVPSWLKDEKNNHPGPIYINPGTGFGTGGHETTFLCLKILNQFFRKKNINHCLDFGCGSGILGIAAGKMGLRRVDFCDIDPLALDNCQENIDLNFDQNDSFDYKLYSRDQLPLHEYDLIIANILLSAFKLESSFLLESLKENGYLIISGVFKDQMEELSIYFNQNENLREIIQLNKNEWSAVLWQKEFS
jgi:ribosomal protein L11 methyltransferase